ncbi:MAG TPA: 30S ribosomal protein S12 methylthiotransferase RimO [Acidobacteriota bacterium]
MTEKKKAVALVSLGCAKNLVDSEVMLGILRRAGFRLISRQEEADVLIVNTCGFIRAAREEAETAIRRALRIKRSCPGRRVIVIGCYVQRFQDRLAAAFPAVDTWLGVGDYEHIDRAAAGQVVSPSRTTFLYSHLSPRLVSTPASWAYLKISEGCSHRCSFCSIPAIKGPYRSRSRGSILEEASRLAARGIKEINLVSQDSTSYGRDLGYKYGLAGLLEKLDAVEGLAWIRVLYGYPEEVSGALLEAMQAPKVCRYLDLPFQHAASKIIKAMGRGLAGDKALALLDKIRRALPQVAIRTSLIVGFPGEGRKEFKELLGFARKAGFDHLGVFTYSPEEGVPASRLGNPVPEKEKAERRQGLMLLQQEISLRNNRKYLGQRLEVLLDKPVPYRPHSALGRTRFQAPEVDGLVKVSSSASLPERLQSICQVEIVRAGVYDLQGRLTA